MANITILEALNRSLTATKKYVDDSIAEVNAKGYAPLDSPNFTNSISMGRKEGTTIGVQSVALGDNTTASGTSSHAEGNWTIASGDYSHAEGEGATASGEDSHAEGFNTTASGDFSHAEGANTTASGYTSHAEGRGTTASSENQHVQGRYNIEDTTNTYAHIVGNGTAVNTRSNAHTLDWNGNGWYKGKLSQDGTPTEDKDLTTKKYVDDKVAEANASGGYTHPDNHPASMITGLATVATSGSYNDLNDKPTIPTTTSQLTNDSGYITSSSIPSSLPASGGNADTVGGYTIWVGTQAQYNAITSKSSTTIYLIKEG